MRKMWHKPSEFFVYYTGQKLYLADLVVCAKGGVAMVNSGLTTNEPSRLDSIPENWTCDLKAIKDYGNLVDDDEEVFDKILFYMPLGKIVAKFVLDT